jgi:uncharacterized protein YejL (UPF0352 family)
MGKQITCRIKVTFDSSIYNRSPTEGTKNQSTEFYVSLCKHKLPEDSRLFGIGPLVANEFYVSLCKHKLPEDSRLFGIGPLVANEFYVSLCKLKLAT